jgi:lipoprotein-releasing system permease protein
VTLRTAQSLFGMRNSVNVILVKVNDLFRSDEVADRIQSLVPYEARWWSREYPSFVSSLTVQAASAYLISGFSLIASSFAIASVLIVSVLQKSKQIGILKSRMVSCSSCCEDESRRCNALGVPDCVWNSRQGMTSRHGRSL